MKTVNGVKFEIQISDTAWKAADDASLEAIGDQTDKIVDTLWEIAETKARKLGKNVTVHVTLL
jgi:hypothetical protein